MKKKPAAAMAALLLAGAGAVVFLVFSLVSSEGPGRRGAGSNGRPDAGGRGGIGGDGPGAGNVATVVAAHNDGRRSTKGSGGFAGRRALPKREPFDSPKTLAERSRMATRVGTLLDKLLTLERSNFSERHKTMRELNDLVRKLGHRVPYHVKQRLLEMLHTVPVSFRTAIGDVIGSMQGDEDVAKILIDQLRDGTAQDSHTRNAIYVALGKMNAPGVNPRLMEMLGKNFPLEHRIVQVLQRTAGPAETRKLLDLLGTPLKPQTESAILQAIKAKRNLPGILNEVAAKLGASSDAGVQQKLMSVLSLSKHPEHVETVHELFKNTPHATVRHAAIRALGQFGDEKSGEILLDLVQNGSPADRRKAASAMNNIRDPKTVDRFAKHWSGLEGAGRRAVMSAAAQLARPSERLTKLAREEGLRDEDMLTRMRAARVLGRPKADGNVEAVSRFLLEAKHAGERTSALSALQKIGTKKAAEAALSALHVVPQKVIRDRYVNTFEKIRALAERSKPPR